MIEPLLSLALSMQGNPGVYALLLGSGISRSAGMPTGWEVVLDLLRKLAATAKEDPEPDPEAWYTKKYGNPPGYSDLLEAVAKSQAERSQLLRSYFEPTQEELEEGRKIPTAAHRAIAGLVKMGLVRLLITTNFDRLIENALEAEGINPTVIRSADDIDGAVPLTHSQCTVIKVHGDYLDLRTRNTLAELESYDPRLDSLLDRVFDEFGLVVCGWSAEWDRALCSAVRRAKGRRFTTYWTSLGKLGDAANHLAAHRAAHIITIGGADEFFESLAEKARTLVEMKAPHPLSVQAAIAQTKRYLSEARYRIRLHDLLMGEVEKLIQETGPARFPAQSAFSNDELVKRIGECENLSTIASSIIATGCFWGTDEHRELWIRAINRLANREQQNSGVSSYISLQMYPAVLLHHSAGIAAAAAGKLDTIYAILTQPRIRGASETYLSTELFTKLGNDAFKIIPGLQNRYVPRSERIFSALREPLRAIIPGDIEYTEAFDLFETLQSLEAAERVSWAMPGQFMFRYYSIRGDRRILRRDGAPLLAMKDEIERAGKEAPVLKAGFLKGSPQSWEAAVQMIDAMTGKFH